MDCSRRWCCCINLADDRVTPTFIVFLFSVYLHCHCHSNRIATVTPYWFTNIIHILKFLVKGWIAQGDDVVVWIWQMIACVRLFSLYFYFQSISIFIVTPIVLQQWCHTGLLSIYTYLNSWWTVGLLKAMMLLYEFDRWSRTYAYFQSISIISLSPYSLSLQLYSNSNTVLDYYIYTHT